MKHYQGGGLIFSLLGAGIALGLFMTPDNGKNRGTRLSMLMAFAFLTGLGLGPLLSMAIMVNPSLVPSAFMLTSAIFACFTGAALFAPDGKYLYLGGTLLSGLSTLLFLGFLNIFFRSQLLFQVPYICLGTNWTHIESNFCRLICTLGWPSSAGSSCLTPK